MSVWVLFTHFFACMLPLFYQTFALGHIGYALGFKLLIGIKFFNF